VSKDIGVPPRRINEIIKGRRSRQVAEGGMRPVLAKIKPFASTPA
jgi:hypothetical protein